MMDNLSANETKTKVIIIEENTGRTTWMNSHLSEEEIVKLLHNSASSSTFPPAKVYEDHVFIHKDSGYKKIAVSDILYLEAARNYCDIYLVNGSCLDVTMPMNEVYEYLSPRLFKRVHRSFVINLQYVDIYVGNFLVLTGGKEISIGREYRESVKKEFVCIGSRKRVREKNE